MGAAGDCMPMSAQSAADCGHGGGANRAAAAAA
jgi:hypothetical protein